MHPHRFRITECHPLLGLLQTGYITALIRALARVEGTTVEKNSIQVFAYSADLKAPSCERSWLLQNAVPCRKCYLS